LAVMAVGTTARPLAPTSRLCGERGVLSTGRRRKVL
jgi:hypothetical protein